MSIASAPEQGGTKPPTQQGLTLFLSVLPTPLQMAFGSSSTICSVLQSTPNHRSAGNAENHSPPIQDSNQKICSYFEHKSFYELEHIPTPITLGGATGHVCPQEKPAPALPLGVGWACPAQLSILELSGSNNWLLSSEKGQTISLDGAPAPPSSIFLTNGSPHIHQSSRWVYHNSATSSPRPLHALPDSSQLWPHAFCRSPCSAGESAWPAGLHNMSTLTQTPGRRMPAQLIQLGPWFPKCFCIL